MSPTVFISYSQSDSKWKELLVSQLRVLEGESLLEIWHDGLIPPGADWQPAIEAAMATARVAIFIVSANFLNSSFIRRQEIPALMERRRRDGVQIIPLIASSCPWQEVRWLAAMQARPFKGKTLALLGGVRAQKALSDLAEEILTLVGTAPRPDGRKPPAAQQALATSARGGAPPASSGVSSVPPLPPHFLPRKQDFDALKASLLTPAAGPAGGPVTRQAVGVLGMGGIGKSVLAAAVAADEEVHAAFSQSSPAGAEPGGGVFWVAVGQAPDIVHLQLELAAAAAGETRLVRGSAQQARLALSRLFHDRRILLVLDDVWDLDAAAALDVIGPRGRLLITTRDRAVLVGLGAMEYKVMVLESDQALALLGGWAGQAVSDLPGAALQVAVRCGYLPLALAMIGAMVRLGPARWADALRRLKQADLDKIPRSFPNYPYPHLQSALAVGVEALPAEERERYRELAALPDETAMPEAALETLWARAGLSALDARDLATRLVARSLAQRDVDGGLRLHDLQADHLRREVGDLRQVHGRWVDAYAARCPAGFASGPNDGYFFQRLTFHLRGAGRLEEVRALLLDFRWLAAKLAVTGINALLAEYEAFPADRELLTVQGALRLAAHVLVQRPEELAGQLLGRLLGQAERGIAKLLEEVRPETAGPWLRPLGKALTAPCGPLERVLEGHRGAIQAVAALPQGRVASGSADGTVRIWDVASGETIRTLKGRTLDVTAVAALPAGRVASGSAQGALEIWDLVSGRTLATLQGHSAAITAVAALPEDRLASGSADRTLCIWDLATGRASAVLKGHSARITAVAALADGRVVSSSEDATLRVWDLVSGRTAATLEGHAGSVNAVAVLDEGRVVSASEDGTLRVWDLASGRTVRTLQGAASRAVAVLPDGRIVAGTHGRLRIWDLASDRTADIQGGDWDWIRAIVALPGGRVVSAAAGRTLHVWDLAQSETVKPEGHSHSIQAMAVLPGGNVVSVSGDSTLRVWDLPSGHTVKVLSGPPAWIRAVAALPGGRVVSASDECTLRIWSLQSGRSLKILKGHTDWIRAVAVLPGGDRLISASDDCTLRIWSMASGRTARILQGHSNPIRAVVVLPNGRVLSASDDRTLRIWDIGTGRTVRILRGHSDWVTAVASLPGNRIVSASRDRTLRVWDLASGRTVRTVEGQGAWVSAVAALPNGLVVVASDDYLLRIWDVAEGKPLACLTLDARATALAVLPGGSELVAGDGAGRIHHIRVADGEVR